MAVHMPFVTSAFYFVFILFYYSEMQKQANIQRERDILDTQFRQAQTELSTLRQMHQNAATYRHDMRHHFAFLQGLASKGHIAEIKEYLRGVQSDIDAITPIRFCENETVNLILSSFSAKAEKAKIQLITEVKLTGSLPFTDTELCSLFKIAEKRHKPRKYLTAANASSGYVCTPKIISCVWILETAIR